MSHPEEAEDGRQASNCALDQPRFARWSAQR
jgi:hypothetical protein